MACDKQLRSYAVKTVAHFPKLNYNILRKHIKTISIAHKSTTTQSCNKNEKGKREVDREREREKGIFRSVVT